ncbi:MAG: dethiobiotin synthase [Flavobacterium sp.]|jgi:dethiobiotin synthetase
MKNSFFVTGIGTDVGKTVCCSILCELLEADYWKPVQSGSETDASQIRQLVSNEITIFKERYALTQPLSPHAAAAIDKVNICLADFQMPVSNKTLIIEGAGGLLVPINNDGFTIADLIKHLNQEVILISKHYLGSINHTLLTIEALKSRKIPIKGIIFNGQELPKTEEIIQKISGVKTLFTIPEFESIDKQSIANFAKKIKEENILVKFL